MGFGGRLGFANFGWLGGRCRQSGGGWLQFYKGETLKWVWEAGGLYIGKVGWPFYANAPSFSLTRPTITFPTGGDPYELRFRRNLDPRAKCIEPVDSISLRYLSGNIFLRPIK